MEMIYFVVISLVSEKNLNAYLHSFRGDVSSFAKKNVIFLVFYFLSCFSFKYFGWGILTKCIW